MGQTIQTASLNPYDVGHTAIEDEELQAGEARPWEWWREQCRDLFFLCDVVLSTAFADKFQDFGIMHRKMCKFFTDDSKRRKFISVFRGSYKSTVVLGFAIWLFIWGLADGKAVSVCYNTATKENAEIFMTDFREILKTCELLRWIFPEIPATTRDYRRDSLTKVEAGPARFHVASLDTKQVGRHYTIMINDDLVNDVNAFSDNERKRIIRQWKFQKSIVTRHAKEKIGWEIDVGTPYHSRDLISEIAKMESYDKFYIPYALPDDEGRLDLHEERGVLTFPEKFCWEDFQNLHEEQGDSIFASQYELRTLEEMDTLAKEEDLIYWDMLPRNYQRYMIVDPAGTEDKENCPTGVVIADINEAGTAFMVYAQEHWIGPYKLIKLMESLQAEFSPDETYVEREKYSITIADTMEHLAPKLNFSFVSPGNRDKKQRIRRLKQRFETGRIQLARGMKTLARRIAHFPDCQYYDMLDALAYLIDVMIPPKRGYVRDLPEDPESQFKNEIESFIAKMKKYSGNEGRLNDAVF